LYISGKLLFSSSARPFPDAMIASTTYKDSKIQSINQSIS
jgi:hypothetical protein